MAPLGLIDGALPAPEPAATALALRLQMEDVLATSHRVWVRGRVLSESINASRRWWEYWRRPALPAQSPAVAHLQTRLSSQSFEADVPIGPDGRFEVTFPADLATSRRGWRIARHQLTWAGQTGEACGVTLMPPEDAVAALVLVLPLSFTTQEDGCQQLASSELAARLAPLLRRFEQGPRGRHAIYYLASVPSDGSTTHSELALAVTSLGWPAGQFVLIPSDGQGSTEALGTGLKRLRWLLAGSLELDVVNLEPGFSPAVEPASDLASVRRCVRPDEDPWKALGEAGPGTSRALLRPVRARLVPRYPVVFCHGMLAFSRLRFQVPVEPNYFSPLREFLRQRGVEALYPNVEPTGGVAARAEQLRDQIRSWSDGPVNLIAHSMGGLDARCLIRRLGFADRVASLTSVATPHRGSALAEWFHENFRASLPLTAALEAMGVNLDGFRDCRPAICRQFNEATPDHSDVHDFSYAAEVSPARLTPALRRAWNLISQVEGPNDGLVSSRSAQWGELLGVLHVDHFAQTPDGLFVRAGENFDALGFYARLIEDLARRGF
jgi:triacylglycerol lipase